MVSKKSIVSLSVMLFLIVGSAACSHTVPIVNYENMPIISRSDKTLSLDDINKAINIAAVQKNWQISNVSPGQATATLVVRGKHTIIVSITYTEKEWSLKYKDSDNMHYKADINGNGTINRKYNMWVAVFVKAINQELLNVRK
jgi:hypothetical protein